jgi:hypothetical protein
MEKYSFDNPKLDVSTDFGYFILFHNISYYYFKYFIRNNQTFCLIIKIYYIFVGLCVIGGSFHAVPHSIMAQKSEIDLIKILHNKS